MTSLILARLKRRIVAGGPGSGRKPTTEDKAIGALVKHGYTGKPDASTGGITSVYRNGGGHTVLLNHMKETFTHWAPDSMHGHVTGQGRFGKLPSYLKELHTVTADGSINWTSPAEPMSPDFYESYYGISPVPTDHAPSLKNPIRTKIPTAQDGWKKGDSKASRRQAMQDLVYLHQWMRRQIGKPEMSVPGSMPTDPHSMVNVPVGSGLSSSALVLGKLRRRLHASRLKRIAAEFNPDQLRDKDGKWATDPGGSERTTKAGDTLVPAKRDETGNRSLANGDKLPDHVSSLKIPPAWTSVVVNTDPRGTLMAQGRDVKGRLQSIYSERYSNSTSAQKFARIKALEAKADRIAAQNDGNRKKDLAHADAVSLIMSTGIRPGSDKDTSAAKQAYGATTLQGKHVVTDENGNVSLQFTGKKGIDLNIPIKDPGIASMLTTRAEASGPDGRLFGGVTDSSLRDYTHTLDGGSFKPKDFRTLLANRIAVSAMSSVPEPTNASQYKKAVMRVAKTVSARLGNTPAVALASYINPVVFSSWRGSAHV